MSTERRCIDCGTLLSMYNKDVRCSLHQRNYLVAESIVAEEREQKTRTQRELARGRRITDFYCTDCRHQLPKYAYNTRCLNCSRIYRWTETTKERERERRTKRLMQLGNLTPETIVHAVANSYDISVEQIYGSSREAEITWARHVAMYLIRRDLGRSFPEIARDLEKQDHTTVLHACRKIAIGLEGNPEIQTAIDQISRRYMLVS